MFDKIAACACLTVLFLAPSCGEQPDSKPAGKSLPESYWLASAPSGAVDVKAARGSAKDGSEIIVTGRVGDILANRAQFKLIDKSFTPCNARPEDKCATPWDYCCEEPTALNAGTIVVEFRDKGALRKATAKGFHGLDHLKSVVVRGKVVKDEAGNLILVAAGMHVEA